VSQTSLVRKLPSRSGMLNIVLCGDALLSRFRWKFTFDQMKHCWPDVSPEQERETCTKTRVKISNVKLSQRFGLKLLRFKEWIFFITLRKMSWSFIIIVGFEFFDGFIFVCNFCAIFLQAKYDKITVRSHNYSWES
jgi:hypothetical protein